MSLTAEVAPPMNPTLEEFFSVALSIVLTGKEDSQVRDAVLDAWVIQATFEDSQAHWNPSDTTQFEPGADAYNSFGPGGRYHVWNYASAEQGISAFLSTLGAPEYAPLRRVMLDPTTTLEVVLAAIATSPWTGITNDPGLYSGVKPEYDRLVPGPGGWPYTKVAPVPAPAPAAEIAKVESAIDAQIAQVRVDEAAKPVDKAAVAAKIAEIQTHLSELADLTK